MLSHLNGQMIGRYRLDVELVGRARFPDRQDALLYVVEEAGRRSERPIFRGRCSAGRPSISVPAWIDGEFVEPASGAQELGTGLDELYTAVAEKLGALLPAGGRLWIAYEAFDHDGQLHRETRAGLAAGVPLIATPIGRLLFRAGCWTGLRNWDFAEGGREGPRKLQGNRALNVQHARARAAVLVRELLDFLQRPADDGLIDRALARTREILPVLQSIVDRPGDLEDA